MHCFNLTKAKASRDRSAAASALVPVIECAVDGVEAAALEVVAYAVGAAVWRGFKVKYQCGKSGSRRRILLIEHRIT